MPSRPRAGQQKTGRRNCNGKLTGEAGPVLRAEVHRGCWVAGESSRVFFAVGLRDEFFLGQFCRIKVTTESFPLGEGELCFGIGGFGGVLRGRGANGGGWRREECGVNFLTTAEGGLPCGLPWWVEKGKLCNTNCPKQIINSYIWEIWSYLGVGGMCGFESRSGNESKQQFGRQKKPRELCSLSSHRRLCPSRILNHLADERTNLERNGSEPTRQRIITRSLAIARGWLCPGGRNFLGAGKLAGCVWGTLAWSFPRLPEFGSRRTLTLSTFAVCQPRRPTRLWMEVRRA